MTAHLVGGCVIFLICSKMAVGGIQMDKSLTIKERLILANQYDILAKLTDDDHEKKHFENLREVFTSGYSLYYSLATEWFSEEVSENECRFVTDVLNLYRVLYFSWSRNDEMKEVIDEKDVLFNGFDLNDSQEVKYYSFYKFLVEQLDRYSEIKDLMNEGKIKDFNSHGSPPSMDSLSNMILKLKEINNRKQTVSYEDLTIDEVKAILNEK